MFDEKLLFVNNIQTTNGLFSKFLAIEWTHSMCQSATRTRKGARARGTLRAIAALAATGFVWAQAPAVPDWRHIGNSAVELSLASPASGSVSRVWYSPDGARLYAQTADGRVFETADFEKWNPSTATAPAPADPGINGRPSVSSPVDPLRVYSWDSQVWRSDDGGVSWADVTGVERRSILGGDMRDLAVSPREADEITAANDRGVWRSLDGGLSWTGLNDSLPNLPATRILALPQGAAGLRLNAGDLGAIEWPAGETHAWRSVPDRTAEQDSAVRAKISAAVRDQITAAAASGDSIYAGSADGRMWTSTDKGRNWMPAAPAPGDRGPVEAIWVDPRDPRVAVAALGRNARGTGGTRVIRTVNAGQFWDDLTSDLPDGSVNGIAADRNSGSIYAATDRGLYITRADLNSPTPATAWSRVPGLPQGRVLDVRLDSAENQIFTVVAGYGAYAGLAPHRSSGLRLVNAADFSQRPAAPGSLLSVVGGQVLAARAGDVTFPVLAASDTESQIQVPFTVRGPALSLSLETRSGTQQFSVPIETASPAIFVDRDSTPLLLDGDTGVLLDAMNTAHSNSRVQILATGLGRVRPDWPAGMAGPAENPPEVVAPVRAYLDRAPVEVTRAVLAPGYIGLYLVEVQLPTLVNAGPAELYIEEENQQSNRVRIWIEP